VLQTQEVCLFVQSCHVDQPRSQTTCQGNSGDGLLAVRNQGGPSCNQVDSGWRAGISRWYIQQASAASVRGVRPATGIKRQKSVFVLCLFCECTCLGGSGRGLSLIPAFRLSAVGYRLYGGRWAEVGGHRTEQLIKETPRTGTNNQQPATSSQQPANQQPAASRQQAAGSRRKTSRRMGGMGQIADRVVGRAASPLAARCAHAVLAGHNLNIIYYIITLHWVWGRMGYRVSGYGVGVVGPGLGRAAWAWG
jgi:hypothetical protein